MHATTLMFDTKLLRPKKRTTVYENVTSADSQTLTEDQDDLSNRAPSNGFFLPLCQCENVHANGEIGRRTSIHACETHVTSGMTYLYLLKSHNTGIHTGVEFLSAGPSPLGRVGVG